MDDVPPTVFQPVDGDGEYALVVDPGDAPLLRDVLQAAAMDRFKRAASTARAGTIRTRNQRAGEVFAKYAERFEYVRRCEAARITALINKASQD